MPSSFRRLNPQVFLMIAYYPLQPLDRVTQAAEEAVRRKCAGLFLLSTVDAGDEAVINAALYAKRNYKSLKIGINLLGKSAFEAVNISLDSGLDATWSTHPVINPEIGIEAINIAALLKHHPNHNFFTSVDAMRKTALDPATAARRAVDLGFIPVANGQDTEAPPPAENIQAISQGIHGRRLAIAAGLTPNNIRLYSKYITYAIVGPGISEDGAVSDKKLQQFMTNIAA